ncbi:solute carrier family 25 member 53 isoform X2 [Chelonia mydas]|uniref:solute carrier family 25 member 53 isoform X2 n=2 Tax=Chelonia mydas TaxID=8469 RepID=UPI0018A1E152|nr:solute carrier family 25 member 53 isoform X2 [Chelonia mydas]
MYNWKRTLCDSCLLPLSPWDSAEGSHPAKTSPNFMAKGGLRMGDKARMQHGDSERREEEERRWSSRSYNVGAVSSFLSTLVTFPIYKTIFRQQIHAFSIQEAIQQLHQEGMRRFYRGLFPPLLSKTLQGTLLFGTHDSLLLLLTSNPSKPCTLWERWTAGFLSGSVEALVLNPFERVQNVLQDGRKDVRFPNTRSILQEFNSYGLKERLVVGYYRGLSPVLLRNSLGSALYFSFKDPLRDSLAARGLPSWLPALVSGSVNGTVTCLALYPLSVLIANMQSQVVGRDLLGLRQSVWSVWESHGRKLTLLYRGGSLLVLRSCLTWGLTTAIHDFLKENTGQKSRVE